MSTTPVTHTDDTPADLIGRLVKVRPYYNIPSSGSSLTPARSPYTFEARVTETFGTDQVVVEFAWTIDAAPWRRRQAYYPRELHHASRECTCPACTSKGDGITELHGA